MARAPGHPALSAAFSKGTRVNWISPPVLPGRRRRPSHARIVVSILFHVFKFVRAERRLACDVNYMIPVTNRFSVYTIVGVSS